MTTPTRSTALDLLWIFRSTESTPPGDRQWAEHCTRQQAVILSLSYPGRQIDSLDQLTEVTGICIDLIDDIPVDGTAFCTAHGWRIHISSSLSPTEQIRVALHELKHIIDNPVRQRGMSDFTDADFEYLADYFADCVLRGVKP